MSQLSRKQVTTKKPTKIERILEAFCRGEQLHRFNAFHLRETALHSTVSSLVNGYGLALDRKPITVERQGDQVRVMLYWLPPSSQQKANELLEFMRSRRCSAESKG